MLNSKDETNSSYDWFAIANTSHSGWANGSRKRLKTDEKFLWILNPVCRGQYKFTISPKIVLPFLTFPGGVENTCSQFSRKLFNQFENYLRIFIKVLEFYKICAA